VDSAGYDLGAWETFAVAEVGAAAALAGLLVVAASINIGYIIRLPHIINRLSTTLVPGVLLAFATGMVNSWSALIEILR